MERILKCRYPSYELLLTHESLAWIIPDADILLLLYEIEKYCVGSEMLFLTVWLLCYILIVVIVQDYWWRDVSLYIVKKESNIKVYYRNKN